MFISIVSQILLVFGYIIGWSAYYRKDKSSILSVDLVAKVCYISGCLLTGGAAINGIETSLFVMCRSFLVKRLLTKSVKVKLLLCISLLSIYLFILYLDYHGLVTILFSIPTITTTCVVIFGTEQHMRLLLIPNAIIGMCIYANLGLYASIPCEVISCIIGLTSYIRASVQNKNVYTNAKMERE